MEGQAFTHRCLGCGSLFKQYVAWCVRCFNNGLVVPFWQQPQAAFLGESEVATAAELVKRSWDELRLACYPDIRLGPDCMALVYGDPGAGKSTWLCRALDSVDGPVVLAQLEEGAGPTTGERLSRLKIHRRDFYIFGRGSIDQMVELVRQVSARALGIDSVQVVTLTPGEVRKLCSTGVAVFVVSQVTKAASVPAGSHRWSHESDVILKVEGHHWVVEKSRYQEDHVGGAV